MLTDLLFLFGISLLSATLLPGVSDIYLISLSQDYPNQILDIWLAATLGNSLGGALNYYLGRYLLHWKDKKWFPIKDKQLQKSQDWFNRYGTWSILLAWVPILGDPLTIIAGIMKMHFGLFILLILIGKGVRYGVIIGGIGLIS